MNERIRELAEQAGLSHMPSNYPDMADLYKGADFELEKFAELIVRECGDIAFEHWAVTHDTSPQESILKNFGIE